MARSQRQQSSGEGLIGAATRVRGRVTGEGDLRLDGSVEGDITLRGDLTIGDDGSANGNVDAQSVTVSGALDGDVSARGPVRILAGARVKGDMQGESVSIEDGAQFAGRLDCAFELPPELGGTTARRR
jgi:cytoskeletal protein CcmA (bactofilin family)